MASKMVSINSKDLADIVVLNVAEKTGDTFKVDIDNIKIEKKPGGSINDTRLIHGYTYSEKSDLGARDRKYYKLNSAFSLTVAVSQDTFAIKNQKMVESRYNESKKFYEKYDSTPSGTGKALTHLQSNLMEIEDEISNLELRLNDLRALKQLILKQLHQIGRESFEGHLDREVLYDIVEDRGRRKNDRSGEKEFNRKRVSRLAETLNENESHIKDAMVRISNKLEKNTAKILFGNLG